MGVPKFFRWISERYPKINQRVAFCPTEETYREHFDGTTLPEPLEPPDAMALLHSNIVHRPPIDRLYLDMNGILHGCSHNNAHENGNATNDSDGINNDDTTTTTTTTTNNINNNNISRAEIYRNVCYYLDRIVRDIAQPTELVYMAIDGVAPRAKLNQQRSRRYRTGKEGEIERTVYESHLLQQQQQQQQQLHNQKDNEEEEEEVQYEYNADRNEYIMTSESSSSAVQEADDTTAAAVLQEVEPGRFTGKFTTHDVEISGEEPSPQDVFHSNSITPGTPFFTECTAHLQHFIQYKLTHDPKWQHLTIIFSGPNVPGEGEHKIMSFMRNEKLSNDYNPNTRHCIMGQDGDLIMLGLATHEPNLVLLREQVIFDMTRKKQILEEGSSTRESLERYIHNYAFDFLHMGILRDYLAYEFETSNVVPDHPWDLEHVVDDFVFLTFFVGNDFLPHMPAMDIADEAFDLLFYNYKRLRHKWLSEKKKQQQPPYLTNAGEIVSGQRLEEFLTTLGSHETIYYDNKKRTESAMNARLRKLDRENNRESCIPSDEVLASKEEADRAKYREMLEGSALAAAAFADDTNNNTSVNGSSFAPVMSSEKNVFQPQPQQAEEEIEDGILTRMKKLLQFSLSSSSSNDKSNSSPTLETHVDDQDLKGRYYYDKFQFTPFDAEKHIALRKAYIEGLVWNLKYYYQGCVSWDWYYPYHYGPMLSDIVNIDEMLEEISFDDIGEPLRPFEQLMGCLPPSSADLLPEPYHWLLTDETSPINDFYPSSFTVDMNGKRWPWEAVVLLPFIDSKRLIDAARTLVPDEALSEEERERNKVGEPVVFSHDAQHRKSVPVVGDSPCFAAIEECTAKMVPFVSTTWNFQPRQIPLFRPQLPSGVDVPQPGFPTLREARIQSLWRKRLGINVFGMKSRYATAVLELADDLPELPPVSVLGPKLVGGPPVFVGYPYLTEGFVTAVSDENFTIRGKQPLRAWNQTEKEVWREKLDAVARRYERGEGLTGTGGWKLPECRITLSVRPLQGIKSLPDGTTVKIFARFELEVPLHAALVTPTRQELVNVPARLEKDPYFLDFAGKNKEVDSETVVDTVSMSAPPSVLNHSKETVSVLPPFENNSGRLPPTIDIEFSQILPPLDGEQSETPSLSIDPSDTAPLFSGSRSLPRGGGGRLRTGVRRRRKSPRIGRRYSTVRTTSLPHSAIRTQGSARGRLFAVGAAAAAALFANGGMTNAELVSPCSRSKPSLSRPPSWGTVLRGGYQEAGAEDLFGLKHEMGTVPPPPLEFAHGTTTLSFIFQGGIVAAVDSRASIGNFVGSKTTQKVLPVNDHILGTMAGGAADCSFWIRKLKAEAQLHELTEGRRMSVARASRILSNALYQNRGLDLSVGTMIMGFDQDGGPSIYYVDNSGIRIKGDLFAVGSGSTFALGILDTERRHDMTEEEAISLGIKAIRHATFRDAYSGGFIGVYLITKDGWKKVYSEDLAQSAEHMRREIEERENEQDGSADETQGDVS